MEFKTPTEEEFNAMLARGEETGWLYVGYKMAWFAIQHSRVEVVAAALSLRNLREINWYEFATRRYRGAIYLTPPHEGWIILSADYLSDSHFGSYIATGKESLVGKTCALSAALDCEVQYFMTYRISESHGYLKAINGELIRAFGYGSDEGNFWEFGEETDEEEELGFEFDVEFDEEDENGEADYNFINEDHIIDIARAWSIDPMNLDPVARANPHAYFADSP